MVWPGSPYAPTSFGQIAFCLFICPIHWQAPFRLRAIREDISGAGSLTPVSQFARVRVRALCQAQRGYVQLELGGVAMLTDSAPSPDAQLNFALRRIISKIILGASGLAQLKSSDCHAVSPLSQHRLRSCFNVFEKGSTPENGGPPRPSVVSESDLQITSAARLKRESLGENTR